MLKESTHFSSPLLAFITFYLEVFRYIQSCMVSLPSVSRCSAIRTRVISFFLDPLLNTSQSECMFAFALETDWVGHNLEADHTQHFLTYFFVGNYLLRATGSYTSHCDFFYYIISEDIELTYILLYFK